MIKSIPQLFEQVKATRDTWKPLGEVWFRGEPESATPLLPKLFRTATDEMDENVLVQRFRSLGPTYASGLPIPTREHNDQWLFVMQHVGAPTRLLDWTEGLLQAVYFALEETTPIVWMVDVYQLNALSGHQPSDGRQLPISWGNEQSPAHRNIQAAFRLGQGATDYPVAFLPTYVHPRMAAQRCAFTVHGSRKVSIASIGGLSHVAKYDIDRDPKVIAQLKADLRMLGVSRRSLFPDFEGLGKDMSTLLEG